MGLGNPGPTYLKTRHNAGFIFLDILSNSYNFSFTKKVFDSYEIGSFVNNGDKVVCVKPTTYMNNSGQVLPKIFRTTGFTIDNCLVVVDNMDLEFGKLRLKKGGGDAGHNGIKSIIATTGSKNFYRLYVGVGRPKKIDNIEKEQNVVSHVLGKFSDDEFLKLTDLCKKNLESILDLNENNFQKIAGLVNGSTAD